MHRLLELTYQAEQHHFWFRGFRQYMRPLLARATAGVPRARILDCGCGTGSNLEMLKPFGNALGFDLTRIGTEFARDHGHRVAQASISHIPFGNDAFDVVTSFDVYQVLPDAVEQAAIKEMWRVLKPGGRMVLHVSALDILYGAHSALSNEQRRYTRTSLRRLVEGAGFEIERLSYDHISLLPLMLPVRLWHRMNKVDGKIVPGEDEMAIPMAPVNTALTALVSLEAVALRAMDMPIGCSLMCLARKRS